jgi:hypothetical protein
MARVLEMSRDPHVVSALKDKLARLKGERDKVHFRMVALRIEIASVETCLKMFAQDIDPATIPAKITFGRSPADLPKGAYTRTALEILREAGEPLSSQELAACVLQRWERPLTARSFDMAVKAIHGNFSRRKDGIVEFTRDTYPGKWRLIILPLLSRPK